MYRDHPDEIIWPIRTINDLRGIFAYPDMGRTRPGKKQDSTEREKYWKMQFKIVSGFPASV